jgi:hypothetical protein
VHRLESAEYAEPLPGVPYQRNASQLQMLTADVKEGRTTELSMWLVCFGSEAEQSAETG